MILLFFSENDEDIINIIKLLLQSNFLINSVQVFLKIHQNIDIKKAEFQLVSFSNLLNSLFVSSFQELQ